MKEIQLCPSFHRIKMNKFGRANSYSFAMKIPVKGENNEGSVEAFHMYSFFDTEFKLTKDF